MFIEARGIEKSYGDGAGAVNVLSGIDLVIDKGDTIAVLGASGAGKSTFLNILGALDRPNGGKLLFKDESLFELGARRLAIFRNRNVGFVFQSHHLLPEFTALENVMLPAMIGGSAATEINARAEELLRKVGLGARLGHKPGELSGGEQQRVAIVRAIIQTPDIVLADEPTGNLDKKTGGEVFDMLLELRRDFDITLVVVTHNEELARRMSRRLRIEDGKLSEE